jgi:hypothetical protein
MDMVCLRNKRVDTLHKGDTENNNNNNSNNNNYYEVSGLATCFGPTNILEVFWGVVLDFVSHLVDIS